MCAFTLLSLFAFSRAALHASSRQSGYTADTNATCSPVGDQTGPLAPPVRFVICRRCSPVGLAIHSWPPLT